MIQVGDINKEKVNNYLIGLFTENPIEEKSVLWDVIVGLMEGDTFKVGADYDLAFSCKYVLWKNTDIKTSANTRQASISVGHLSISGLDSSELGGSNIGKAETIYNNMLLNPDTFFLQFGADDGCGCN